MNDQKECQVYILKPSIPKKYFIYIKKNHSMEASSKDININRQSNLKVVCEICQLLEYKPKSLAEVLRINDILCEYTIFGTQTEVKNDIKKLDEYIKNNRLIKVE